jgi:hypothetical protein
MKILLLIFLMVAASCNDSGSSSHTYLITEKGISKLTNKKPLPKDPNLTLDKSIHNPTYPIQIALYEDGKFYYDLPNLGDGTGTWRQSGDKIELKAKRTLFDMYIEIRARDAEEENFLIQFTDRFGPNTLKVENLNAEL